MPSLSISSKKARNKKNSKERSYKKFKAFLFVFGLFLFSITFLGIVALFNHLNSTFASALGVDSRSFDREEFPSVLFVSYQDMTENEEITALSYFILDKKSQKAVVYNLDPLTRVDMPGIYSTEQIKNATTLAKLNDLDDKNSDVVFLKNLITKIFAYKIDYYFFYDESLGVEINQIVKEQGIGLFDFIELTKNTDSYKTNLSFSDLYKLNKYIQSLPDGRLSVVSVNENEITDFEDYDDPIREITFESFLSQENQSVAVLNGSGYQGMAQFGARVVTNGGGRVVAVANASQLYEKTIIITDNPNSETVHYLQSILGNTEILTKERAISYPEDEIERSDITIILGVDFGDAL